MSFNKNMKKRKSSAPGSSNKRARVTKVIGGSVVEMKYFDTVLSATAIPASTDWTGTEFDPATILTLIAPVQGTAINQRVGRKIDVHKVKIRGQFNVAPQTAQSAGDNGTVIRLIAYRDKQTNIGQAQGEQVMDGSPGVANQTVHSFMSLANLGRFEILHDEEFVMDDPNLAGEVAAANVISQGQVRKFQIMLNFKKPVTVHFNATNGGTVADIVDNSWHVIASCSNASLAPTILYVARVSYKDA